MTQPPEILAVHANAQSDKLTWLEDPPKGAYGTVVWWTDRDLPEEANRLVTGKLEQALHNSSVTKQLAWASKPLVADSSKNKLVDSMERWVS
jgi:hypothetical protein